MAGDDHERELPQKPKKFTKLTANTQGRYALACLFAIQTREWRRCFKHFSFPRAILQKLQKRFYCEGSHKRSDPSVAFGVFILSRHPMSSAG